MENAFLSQKFAITPRQNSTQSYQHHCPGRRKPLISLIPLFVGNLSLTSRRVLWEETMNDADN